MTTLRRIAPGSGPWLALACVVAPACFSDGGLDPTGSPVATTDATSTTAAPTTSTGTTGDGTDSTALTTGSTSAPAGCGNGAVDPGEACDDGNDDDGDACLSTCQMASCGDGVVWAGVEECDLGAGNSATLPDTCRPTCKLPACGDGGLYVGDIGPEIVIAGGAAEIAQSNDAPRGIGVDAAGNFAVVWRLNAVQDALHVQRLGPAGEPLGAAVNYLDPPVAEAKDPVIAVAPDGDLALAWETGANANDIYLRGVVGGLAGPGIAATTSLAGNQESVSLALTDSDRAVIAFIAQNGGPRQVRVRLIDNFSADSPPDIPVSEHPAGDATPPTLALHPAGYFAIAWGDPGGQILYRRFAVDGQPGAIVTTALRTGGSHGGTGRPWTGAAIRPTDDAVVVAGLGADGRVALQRFDAADVAQETVPVADAARHFAPFVDVATDAAGNLAVAWVECGEPDDGATSCATVVSDLRLRHVRSDMTPHAPPLALASQPGGASPPLGLAVAPSGVSGVVYPRGQDVIVRVAGLTCP